jgi:hypothetical protein
MDKAPMVRATASAVALIEKLKRQYGALMFHQSGGCCDGSAPMCYVDNEFKVGQSDLKLGEIAGCPFYIDRAQYATWRNTRLIIDVVPGRGSGFSLEAPEGLRFITRSEAMT